LFARCSEATMLTMESTSGENNLGSDVVTGEEGEILEEGEIDEDVHVANNEEDGEADEASNDDDEKRRHHRKSHKHRKRKHDDRKSEEKRSRHKKKKVHIYQSAAEASRW